MQTYRNLGGKSGIAAFDYGEDWIVLRFCKDGRHYRYTVASAGRPVIEIMKQLAEQGRGLNTYINQAKPPFADKW